MTVNIFAGHENSLEMGQLYSVTYSCDFELLMFPFDGQVCMGIASMYMYYYLHVASYLYNPIWYNTLGTLQILLYTVHISCSQ